MVKWYDNIPLVSYVLLRGNCRSCGTHFSPRYFFIELLTGLLFLAVFLSFGMQWQTPFHMVFVSFLIIGTFTDIDYYIIPDGITVGGTVFAVVATGVLGAQSYITPQLELTWEVVKQLTFQWDAGKIAIPMPWWYPLTYSLLSAGFGYLMLWSVGLIGKLLFRKEAMGMGDVKLFAFLGAWMGALNCVWILFLSAFIGSIFGISLLMAHKLLSRDENEVLVLIGEPTVKRQPDAVNPQLQGDGSSGLLSDDSDTINPAGSDQSSIEIKFPGKTTKQLHHFPYGPYIALAALIILLFHQQVDEGIRTFFLLR